MQPDDQTKLAVHWAVSKLVILAVPLLNGLLSFLGIAVTTSSSTTDNIANYLCIGVGLAYSWWAHQQTLKTVPPPSTTTLGSDVLKNLPANPPTKP
jgi:hypothetical protein